MNNEKAQQEPFFIVQTFDADIVRDEASRRAWLEKRCWEAASEGGTWPRATIMEDGTGLLVECWKERPDDEGAPRWMLQAGD